MQEIYTNMSTNSEETIRIFRGMALHKMIRLITCSLGGDVNLKNLKKYLYKY